MTETFEIFKPIDDAMLLRERMAISDFMAAAVGKPVVKNYVSPALLQMIAEPREYPPLKLFH